MSEYFIVGDDVEDFVKPLDLNLKKLVFFVVNNQSSNAAGGSHWFVIVKLKLKQQHFWKNVAFLQPCPTRSLLVYNGTSRQLEHYDSCPGMNEAAARSLASKLSRALHGLTCSSKKFSIKCLNTMLHELLIRSDDSIPFISMQAPKQENCIFF